MKTRSIAAAALLLLATLVRATTDEPIDPVSENMLRKLIDDRIISEDDAVVMRMFGVFGMLGVVVLASYVFCCICACTCAPEMFAVVYNPLCNCAVRSVCWPLWMMRFCFSHCIKRRELARAKAKATKTS